LVKRRTRCTTICLNAYRFKPKASSAQFLHLPQLFSL
jgi:hypothetical protein